MRASGGRRLAWDEVPPAVRRRLEGVLGAAVVEAVSQDGGFSPGLAARCRLDDGRRVFVKAVSPAQNPHACRIHRREAEIASLLPPTPFAPTLRHVYDDGTWVALVFDEVAGRQPAEPWRIEELDAVVPALRAFTRTMTPSPVDGLQTVADKQRAVFGGWRRIAEGDGDLGTFPDWVRHRLDGLVALEDRWEEATIGNSLVHADIRADNLLLTDDGRVVLVDWPWACVGADFVDLAFFLPSVGLGGGPDVATVVDRYHLLDDVDRDGFVVTFVAVAGFFVRSCQDEPPPGIPRLRSFQRAQADVALAWLETVVT